jgi:hypothetical protein
MGSNNVSMIALTVLLLAPIDSEALAQNAPNPAMAAKRQRCEDEGRKMGLSNQRSGSAGGLRPLRSRLHEALAGVLPAVTAAAATWVDAFCFGRRNGPAL